MLEAECRERADLDLHPDIGHHGHAVAIRGRRDRDIVVTNFVTLPEHTKTKCFRVGGNIRFAEGGACGR
ncbi:hypothetical protein D3C83_274800 [compost metagenome]